MALAISASNALSSASAAGSGGPRQSRLSAGYPPRHLPAVIAVFSPFHRGSLSAGGVFLRWMNRDGYQPSAKSSDILGFSSMAAAFASLLVISSFSVSAFQENDAVPIPILLIDQDSDAAATIVELSFGDRLGALLDTMKSLKGLGLDVTKGTVTTEDSLVKTKFFITRLGRKVEDPSMLEKIRLSIINNLLKYHPESSEKLAMGEAFGVKPPQQKVDVDVATKVLLEDDGPKRSLLHIETADRPGLLLEMVKILTDINVDVESAEIDTEGLVAKDKFHVSYRGAALNKSLSEVLTNCLRYYLRRPETEEDSY